MLQITDKVKHVPSHEEIKNIFNEVYNVFYRKWKDISSKSDWPKLMQEARELNKKYDCELCSDMVLGLIKCIENEYAKRSDKCG